MIWRSWLRGCAGRLACAIHVDRANVMTHGTPADVTRAVHAAAKAFDVMNGGAYFYVETDNGFPLENIRALLEAIGAYREEAGRKWDAEKILRARCAMKNRRT